MPTRDGKPTRKERSAANKAAFAAQREMEREQRAERQAQLDEERAERRRQLAMPAGTRKWNDKYNEDIGLEICQLTAGGWTLLEISRSPDMPPISTLYDWLHAHEGFRKQYAIAQELQGRTEAERTLLIQRALLNGDIAPDEARVAAQISQWIASKHTPAMYGDKDRNFNGAGAVQPILNVTLTTGAKS